MNVSRIPTKPHKNEIKIQNNVKKKKLATLGRYLIPYVTVNSE